MPTIHLEKLTKHDAPRLFWLVDHNRPALAKFWWERQTQSAADSEQFIANVNKIEAENGAPTRGIWRDETLVGVGALHSIDWELRTSLLGFWLDKEQTGRGYGTETLRLLTGVAFNELDLNELRISTRADNVRSRGVAEKVGFTLLHVQNEHLWQTEEPLISTATYALDAADFMMQQAAAQEQA